MCRKRDWLWLALPLGLAGGWAEIVAPLWPNTHPSASLNPPTQTSLLTPPQTSSLTPPQTSLLLSAVLTNSLAISHFYTLEVDYLSHTRESGLLLCCSLVVEFVFISLGC